MLSLNQKTIGSLVIAQRTVSEPLVNPCAVKHTSQALVSQGLFEDSCHQTLLTPGKDLDILKSKEYDEITCQRKSTASRLSGLTRSITGMILSEDARWLRHLLLCVGYVCYWDSYQSTYSLRLSSRLPRVLGQRAFNLEMIIRFYTLSWNTFSLLRGSLGTNLIVDCSSLLMVACYTGNLQATRDLIESRRANLHDRRGSCHCNRFNCRTNIGETALFVSI